MSIPDKMRCALWWIGTFLFGMQPSTFAQNPRALFPGSFRQDSVVRIAYLLPLSYKENLELGAGNERKSFTQFLEFYEGGLLALQYWRELGYSIQSQLIDTQSGAAEQSAHQKALEEASVWIGPIYADEFKPYANLARASQKSIVYPLSQMGEVWKDNPFVYQAASDNLILWKRMIDKEIGKNPGENNVIIVPQNQTKEYESYVTFVKKGRESVHLLRYKAGLDPMQNRAELMQWLRPNAVNRLIILSQDEAFLSDLLANLAYIVEGGNSDIHLYGMPRWNKFESLNSSWFFQLNTHIPSAYVPNYQLDLTKRFVSDFMSTYAIDPSPFALQAFDLTNYFVQKQLGLKDTPFPMIQSRFEFEQQPHGGYVNTGGYILEYTRDFDLIVK